MTALLLHSLSGGIQKSPKIPPKNVFEGKVSDQIVNKRATQVHLLPSDDHTRDANPLVSKS